MPFFSLVELIIWIGSSLGFRKDFRNIKSNLSTLTTRDTSHSQTLPDCVLHIWKSIVVIYLKTLECTALMLDLITLIGLVLVWMCGVTLTDRHGQFYNVQPPNVFKYSCDLSYINITSCKVQSHAFVTATLRLWNLPNLNVKVTLAWKAQCHHFDWFKKPAVLGDHDWKGL